MLEKLSAEALNIPKFNEQIFNAKIQKIVIPCRGELIFTLKDGKEIKKTWNYASRSESWTDEMRKLARERQERMKTR